MWIWLFVFIQAQHPPQPPLTPFPSHKSLHLTSSPPQLPLPRSRRVCSRSYLLVDPQPLVRRSAPITRGKRCIGEATALAFNMRPPPLLCFADARQQVGSALPHFLRDCERAVAELRHVRGPLRAWNMRSPSPPPSRTNTAHLTTRPGCPSALTGDGVRQGQGQVCVHRARDRGQVQGGDVSHLGPREQGLSVTHVARACRPAQLKASLYHTELLTAEFQNLTETLGGQAGLHVMVVRTNTGVRICTRTAVELCRARPASKSNAR